MLNCTPNDRNMINDAIDVDENGVTNLDGVDDVTVVNSYKEYVDVDMKCRCSSRPGKW